MSNSIDLSSVPPYHRSAILKAVERTPVGKTVWIHLQDHSPHCVQLKRKFDGRIVLTHYWRCHDRAQIKPQVTRAIGPVESVAWHDAVATAHDCAARYHQGLAVPSLTKGHPQNSTMTIATALRLWSNLMVKRHKWKPTSNRPQKIEILIRHYLEPHFPYQRFDEIPPIELAQLIAELYETHSLTYARDAKSFILNGLGAMEGLGYSETSIAVASKFSDLLEYLAPAERKTVIHRPSLPVNEVSIFMEQLHRMPGMPAVALEVLILTACRVRPVVQMKWRDVNLDAGIWVCPREELKIEDNGMLVVQLSTQVVDILKRLHDENFASPKPSPYVFHAKDRSTHICLDLSHVIQRMNDQRVDAGLPIWTDPEISLVIGTPVRVTPHGFRATFRTWATGEDQTVEYPISAIERCLHHRTKGFLETCYDRNRYPRQQRRILQDWADFCFPV